MYAYVIVYVCMYLYISSREMLTTIRGLLLRSLCLCTYMHVCMCVWAFVCKLYMYTCMNMYAHVYVYFYVYMIMYGLFCPKYVYMYVHVHVYGCLCSRYLYTYTHIYTYVYQNFIKWYVYPHTYTHAHIHMYTQAFFDLETCISATPAIAVCVPQATIEAHVRLSQMADVRTVPTGFLLMLIIRYRACHMMLIIACGRVTKVFTGG
jgi:hypothetical protein